MISALWRSGKTIETVERSVWLGAWGEREGKWVDEAQGVSGVAEAVLRIPSWWRCSLWIYQNLQTFSPKSKPWCVRAHTHTQNHSRDSRKEFRLTRESTCTKKVWENLTEGSGGKFELPWVTLERHSLSLRQKEPPGSIALQVVKVFAMEYELTVPILVYTSTSTSK